MGGGGLRCSLSWSRKASLRWLLSQDLKEGGSGPWGVQGKRVFGGGHSTCKGPEVGQCSAGSRDGSEVHGLEGGSVGMCPGADLCGGEE